MISRAIPIRARSARLSIVGLAALGVVALGCDEGGAPGPKTAGGNHSLIGQAAPEFDLPALSGAKRASLEVAQGKVAIVDFWATWCAPCKVSFPKYQALAQKYSDQVAIVGISEDDESDGIKAFAAETGATFPLGWDAEKNVAKAYRPESMPTSYLIDTNGVVRFVHSGFREGEEKEIEGQLKSLME